MIKRKRDDYGQSIRDSLQSIKLPTCILYTQNKTITQTAVLSAIFKFISASHLALTGVETEFSDCIPLLKCFKN